MMCFCVMCLRMMCVCACAYLPVSVLRRKDPFAAMEGMEECADGSLILREELTTFGVNEESERVDACCCCCCCCCCC